MPITEEDIKLLASERLTDNPDGGGRITGNTIQDAADNNLFDDVADLDRVTGRVSLRKAAVSVQTPDTDKYLSARVMISQVPADPATHGVLFTPTHPDDLRANAVIKLASYLAPGGTYAGLLYGNHIAGMSTVLLLQRTTAPVPVVGDVLYLVQNEGLASQRSQYARITTVATLLRTFEDDSGEFQRLQVTCGISAPLAQNFDGFEAQRQDASINYTGRTRLREVIVADAAQYYGTRPLAEAAALGDLSVKVDSAFAQLLPSSQVETPLANRDPTPPGDALVGSGRTVSYTSGQTWSSTTALALLGSPVPGTLAIATPTGTVTDQGGRLRLGGADVGAVDYSAGICTLATGSLGSGHTVTYQAAGRAARAPQSVGVPVTIGSRAQSYAVFLEPPPLRGSVSLSYRANGRWYTLYDNQAGGLQASSEGQGAGSVNYLDGFATVTLGALPDVGSAVIFQWSGATQETSWPVQTLTAEHVIELPGIDSVQPGSVSLSWGGLTSTDATLGTLGGAHASGSIRYAQREIRFRPNVLPAVGTTVTVNWTSGTKQEDTFLYPSRNGGGQVPVTASLGAIVPGSLEVEWNTFTDEAVLGAYTAAQLREMGIGAPVDPIQIARDDGAGNLLRNGANVGSVNYATGAVVFSPDVVIKIPRPVYTPAAIAGSTRFRVVFSGIDYVDAPSLYPNDESGLVKLRYNSAASGSAQSHSVTFAPTLEAVPGLAVNLLPGGLALSVGGQVYADSGTGVLRRDLGGSLQNAGTVNGLSGLVSLTAWPTGAANAVSRLACVSTLGEVTASQFLFRTAAAPLKPGSFSIRYARPTGGVQVVTAAPDGSLSASGLEGSVDYDTGVVLLNFGEVVTAAGNEAEDWYDPAEVVGGNIWRPAPVAVSTLRYTAVSYTFLPLSEEVLGVPSVQLPQDGRVLIYKPARVLVVHHTQDTAPVTVSNGQTVSTGRTLLAWARVYGANGQEITSGFARDLDAGTVTFTNVAGFSQPVTVRSRIETEALCLDATIDGALGLNRPLAHNYPAGEALVSSVLLGGTLQAGVQPGFSQSTWTNLWSDDRVGDPILAQYDQASYPITVSNEGAITQRWALIFTSTTDFRVVGETRGQIATGNTATPLAPVNPFTGAPLFQLSAAGWGAGWAAGNVLRFNTVGAVLPFWVARTVEQSNPAAPGTDRLTLEVRGSIDV
jgi:hypothetical protein